VALPKLYAFVTKLPEGVKTESGNTVIIDGYRYVSVAENQYYTDKTNHLYVVKKLAARNAFISLQLYLWNYEIGLAINAPVFGVSPFEYVLGSEAEKYGIDSIPEGVRYREVEEFIYSSEDKASDGLDSWKDDYYDEASRKFSPSKYLAMPRYYEYLNEYVEINAKSLWIKDGDEYKAITVDETTGAGFPDYLAEIANGADNYYVFTGSSFEKMQRSYIYRKYQYRSDRKQIIPESEIDKYSPDEFYIRIPQESKLTAPDFEDGNHGDYAYKHYVSINEIFSLALDLRGSLIVSAGKIYLGYEEYNAIFKSINGRDATIDDLRGIAYKTQQGDYVAMTDKELDRINESLNNGNLTDEEKARLLSKITVWANSSLDGEHDGVNEALADVLGGIFGSMKAILQVQEGDVFRLFFSLRVNISFMLKVSPFKLYVHDLDVAIDLWKQNQDKRAEGGGYVDNASSYEGDLTDGSMTHLVGIYYDHDTVTGESGLYVDLSWLLGEDAKIYINLRKYSVEQVLNGMLGSDKLGSGQGDAMAAADADVKTDDDKVLQSPDDASLYLNIFTNAIALNITSGFLRAILEEIDPESTIGDILPNMKAYVKVNLNPYSLAVGALAYNKTGTAPVLKLELALEGLNGDDNSSSLAFGTEDEIRKLQIGSKDIFYYANFYYDSEGEFAKNYDSSDFVRLYKDAAGNSYSVKENGGYILNEDGIIVAKPASYEGVTYAPYNGPSQRYSQAEEVMKEVLPESRYAFGSAHDDRYSHNSEFEGVLYTSRINKETQKTEYVPIAEVETRLDSSKYRDIWDSDVFRNFTGLMFVANSNDLYMPIYKQQLNGYTGEGNLQYRLATEEDKAEDSVYKNRIITAKDAAGETREYVPVDEPLKDADGNYIKDGNGNYVFDGYTDMYEADNCAAEKVYTLKRDFNGYVEALDIDLNHMIENMSNIDILGMLGGLKTLELGLNLDITLKADDIINWSNRMTEFIGDPALTEYL